MPMNRRRFRAVFFVEQAPAAEESRRKGVGGLSARIRREAFASAGRKAGQPAPPKRRDARKGIDLKERRNHVR